MKRRFRLALIWAGIVSLECGNSEPGDVDSRGLEWEAPVGRRGEGPMKASFRPRLALMTLIVVVATLAWPLAPRALAHGSQMITSCGGGWSTPNACKYDQAKYSISGDCGSGSCTISKVSWRGGTASGSCDPSNDIVSWYLNYVQIHRVSDGTVLWRYGPGNTHTNCDSESRNFSRTPNQLIRTDVHIAYQWCFQSSNPTHNFCDTGYFLAAVR